eukprot:404517_1
MDNLAELQNKYDSAVAEKERLANEVLLCSIKLERAEKLIGGLGGEKIRWSESVILLNKQLDNVTGDVVLSSGAIAYVGAFTSDYRLELYSEWRDKMAGSLKLLHTNECDVVSTCGKQVKIRNWNICGLPTDTLSIENGIILDVCERWPLMIDPQNQASRFIKKLALTCAINGFDCVKISDGKTFTRALENGIRFGKWVIIEGVYESLDPQLEPILQRAVFTLKGQLHIKLGDSTIPYNDQFKLFLLTTLPNPHYPPELQVKVTLLNFTVTPSGLQDQMLGLVVAKEAPELESKKNELVISSAAMKKELEEIEETVEISEIKSNTIINLTCSQSAHSASRDNDIPNHSTHRINLRNSVSVGSKKRFNHSRFHLAVPDTLIKSPGIDNSGLINNDWNHKEFINNSN